MKYFLISELACSHNGSIKNLKKLIMNSYRAGADAVQFQIWKSENMRSVFDKNYNYLRKLEIPYKNWGNLIKFTINKYPKMKVYCCIYDLETFNFIKKFNIDGIKINAADIRNSELLLSLKKFKKKINICTGGATNEEITKAIKLIGGKKRITLMHGIQLFPTDPELVNIARIKYLKNKFKLKVGYQDHSDPTSIEAYMLPLMSLLCGASVIEKHMTVSRKNKGADYQASFELSEFKRMSEVFKYLRPRKNNKKYKKASVMYRAYTNKIFFFSKNIKKGGLVKKNDILLKFGTFKQSYKGDMASKFLNRVLKKNVKKDKPVLKHYF